MKPAKAMSGMRTALQNRICSMELPSIQTLLAGFWFASKIECACKRLARNPPPLRKRRMRKKRNAQLPMLGTPLTRFLRSNKLRREGGRRMRCHKCLRIVEQKQCMVRRVTQLLVRLEHPLSTCCVLFISPASGLR